MELPESRRLLPAECRRGIDEFEVADRLHALLRLVPDSRFAVLHRTATRALHWRMVAQARAALVDGGLPLALDALARLVGYSPDHLSRVFHEVAGMTLGDIGPTLAGWFGDREVGSADSGYGRHATARPSLSWGTRRGSSAA